MPGPYRCLPPVGARGLSYYVVPFNTEKLVLKPPAPLLNKRVKEDFASQRRICPSPFRENPFPSCTASRRSR